MEDLFTGKDRRRHKRVKLSLTVVYRTKEPLEVRLKNEEREFQASLSDISEGGTCIITDVNIAVGTILWIRFTLAHVEQVKVNFFGTIEMLGEVRYNNPIKKNLYRLGISFTNVKDSFKHEIANFVDMVDDQLKKGGS
ncbi:MAG: PilZ domain-containing protein [Candidatus Omnitrophota bacterium]|jgi:c-di-GMP-binding flagellar brake protein YcgR